MGKHQRGFTLIELLVVIAIIGILSSVVLASLNGARKKGRDARRISDMKQIQLALELYYDSTSSTYPVQGTAPAAPGTTDTTSVIPSTLAPTYIASIPADPTGDTSYRYQYQSLVSAGTACTATPCAGYLLVAQLESGANASSYTGITLCTADTAAPFTYCVKQ